MKAKILMLTGMLLVGLAALAPTTAAASLPSVAPGGLNCDGDEDFYWKGPAGELCFDYPSASMMAGGLQCNGDEDFYWKGPAGELCFDYPSASMMAGGLQCNGDEDFYWKGPAGELCFNYP